jgi:hypothetical protein
MIDFNVLFNNKIKNFNRIFLIKVKDNEDFFIGYLKNILKRDDGKYILFIEDLSYKIRKNISGQEWLFLMSDEIEELNFNGENYENIRQRPKKIRKK